MAAIEGLLDANVLFDAATRDLLLEAAAAGLLQVRWTERIETECQRALLERRGLDENRWLRLRTLMRLAAPDCLVEGYEALEETFALPDVDDRHVLAAAVVSGSSHIVTFNLRDFPAEATDPHGIVAITPDLLLVGAIAGDSEGILACAERVRQRLSRPSMTLSQYLDRLARRGLEKTAALLRSEAMKR